MLCSGGDRLKSFLSLACGRKRIALGIEPLFFRLRTIDLESQNKVLDDREKGMVFPSRIRILNRDTDLLLPAVVGNGFDFDLHPSALNDLEKIPISDGCIRLFPVKEYGAHISNLLEFVYVTADRYTLYTNIK